jgi:hypothetical protein
MLLHGHILRTKEKKRDGAITKATPAQEPAQAIIGSAGQNKRGVWRTDSPTLSAPERPPFVLRPFRVRSTALRMGTRPRAAKKVRTEHTLETPEKESPSGPTCSVLVPEDYTEVCGRIADIRVLLPNGRPFSGLAFCAQCFAQPEVAAVYARRPRVWLR